MTTPARLRRVLAALTGLALPLTGLTLAGPADAASHGRQSQFHGPLRTWGTSAPGDTGIPSLPQGKLWRAVSAGNGFTAGGGARS